MLRTPAAAAPAPGVAPPATEPRGQTFGGRGGNDPYGAAPVTPVMASRQHERGPAVGQRRSGGLFRSPMMLLALLALAVLIGAIWYASLQREPQVVFDVGDEKGTPAAEQAPVEAPAYDDATPPETAAREAPPVAQAAPRNAVPSEPAETAAAASSPPAITVPRAPAADAEPADAPAPANASSAVATVRAFYSALSAGDGGSAAQLVVPAKRRSGPLSGPALTRYYSSFRRPLRVRNVAPVDADTVRVAYDYVLADGRLCRGTAAVDVNGGLVSAIRTQGPC